jgi:glutaredoxin-like protein NrdH
VTVYTQPLCRPCKRVVNKLEEAGIPVEQIDISKDLVAADYVKRWLQASSVPVIEADGYNPIVGYQPDLLKYLIETYPR